MATQNEDYLAWLKSIEERGGIQVLEDQDEYLIARHAGGTTEFPLRWNADIVVRLGEDQTRYITVLHEDVHVNQLINLREAGIDYEEIIDTLTPDQRTVFVHYLEREAYDLEYYLALREGFNDNYIQDIQDRLAEFWDDVHDDILNSSDILRSYIEIVKTR